MRAAAAHDLVALFRPGRSDWTGLKSGSPMYECIWGACWRHPEPELDPCSALRSRLGWCHGWRNKAYGHLLMAALSKAFVFPDLMQVVSPSYDRKSVGLGQYMQHIHIHKRYIPYTCKNTHTYMIHT